MTAAPLDTGDRRLKIPPLHVPAAVTPAVESSLVTLVAGLSHVVNNQLTALLGNIELASHDVDPDSAAAHRLSESEAAARRIGAVMRSLSTAIGFHWPRTAIADLPEIVRSTCARIGAEAPDRDGIGLEVQDDVPAVACDPGQVALVVEILLHNAIEATVAGDGPIVVRVGTVRIAHRLRLASAGLPLAAGRYAFVEVEDTGSGMDRETLGRAFEPFFSTRVTGRGLSLAVALGIVRAHGGGIVAQSSAGYGTTMRVLLPV